MAPACGRAFADRAQCHKSAPKIALALLLVAGLFARPLSAHTTGHGQVGIGSPGRGTLRRERAWEKPIGNKLGARWRGGATLRRRNVWRGGGKAGGPPGDEGVGTRARRGWMESDSLLAGNVARLQFLRKKTGIDLGTTAFSLYAMAIRTVISTVGQPLRAAKARRVELQAAAIAEKAASKLAEGAGAVGVLGPAAEAAAREALEPMPFAYLPSVGALLMMLLAVGAHVLLVLGKRWSVRFNAWSSFVEVLTWEEADSVLVTPVRHTGTPAICPLSGTPLSQEPWGALVSETATTEEQCDGTTSSASESDEQTDDGLESEETHSLSSESLSSESLPENEPSLLGEEFTSEGDASEDHTAEEEQAVPGRGSDGGDHDGAEGPVATGSGDAPYFVYQRRKFVLKTAGDGDGDGEGSDEGETFGLVELPVGWKLGRYLQAEGLTAEEVSEKLGIFGENSVDVKPPTFWHHLGERLSSPFVVFSLFNQVLWMLELYWLKAMIAMFEVVAFEAAFVADAERRRRQLDVRNTSSPKKRVRAWRGGEWAPIGVEQMLPGDVVSLKAGVTAGGTGVGGTNERGDEEQAFAVGELPADCLVLRGTAVVDEASLTGESVPQIKTSLTSEPIDFEDDLDMVGRHSSHVLLSGTTLLDQTDGGGGGDGVETQSQSSTGAISAAFGASSIPESTPDGGVLCFVLRTGVYSFQGDLRRTIDFGSHGVREESKDAAYLLLFLLSFAALSSSHVVREGLKSNQVSGFRLLVQCVRILSAVVPNDLSFELNQCLRNGVLSLQKGHSLACTEPFRIPLAGKVDVCLFDKTGTITSDKLQAEALVAPQPLHPDKPPVTVALGGRGGSIDAVSEGTRDIAGAARTGLAAEVVVGGCHSLMNVDGVLHGDPLEASALEGIKWTWNAGSHTAHPKTSQIGSFNETAASKSSDGDTNSDTTVVPKRRSRKRKSRGDRKIKENAEEKEAEEAREPVKDAGDGVSVAVWRRYAFSSQLQRMSVVAEVEGGELTARTGVPEAWVLCKGSPEAMVPLLNKGSLPSWYQEEYNRLARAGRRVIALAHRTLGPSGTRGAKEKAMSLSRPEAEAEGSLTFDGFLSFHCKTRADSQSVIRDLRDVADCSVTIVTGDSVLTACHVASEVGLIDAEPDENKPTKKKTKKQKLKSSSKAMKPNSKDAKTKKPLLLTVTDDGNGLRWEPLHPSVSSNGDARKTSSRRMRTTLKGGARVGRKEEEEAEDKNYLDFSWAGVEGLSETHDLCATGPAFEGALKVGDPDIGRLVQHFRVLARMTPALKEELATLLMEAGKVVLMCGDGSNDVGALRRSHVGLALLSGFGDANTSTESSGPGDTGTKAQPVPAANGISEQQTAGGEGVSAHPAAGVDNDVSGGLKGKSTKELQAEEREQIQADITVEFERLQAQGMNPAKAIWKASKVAQQKRVEASNKASFGAQGAFAASAMAMFKNDAENEEGHGQPGLDGVVRTGDASLAAPFTSKKPSIAAVVDVVRQGRCTLAAVLHTYQMVALHALFSSYTSSVLYLMKVRWPQRPLIATAFMFQPLHLALASPGTPEDMSSLRPPRSVFHLSTFLSLLGQAGVHVACMAFAVKAAQAHSVEAQTPPERGLLGPKFVPNAVSNAVFMLATIQSVSVSLVNFKGRPFMRGILECRAIFLPAVAIVAFCFALALELVPAANKLLELALFPSKAVKIRVLLAMAVSLVGPLAVDRLCVRVFHPELHRARMAGPPLGNEVKGNLMLLGILLTIAAYTVATTDFDNLEDKFGISL